MDFNTCLCEGLELHLVEVPRHVTWFIFFWISCADVGGVAVELDSPSESRYRPGMVCVRLSTYVWSKSAIWWAFMTHDKVTGWSTVFPSIISRVTLSFVLSSVFDVFSKISWNIFIWNKCSFLIRWFMWKCGSLWSLITNNRELKSGLGHLLYNCQDKLMRWIIKKKN